MNRRGYRVLIACGVAGLRSAQQSRGNDGNGIRSPVAVTASSRALIVQEEARYMSVQKRTGA